MADTDVKPPETGSQQQVSNDTSPVAAPVQDNSNAELERLRKEKEQAEMRANQLQNQLSEKEKADEAAKAKKLEEEGQYKELLDKERAARQALELEKDTKERQAQLEKDTHEVFSKYNPAVVELAKTAGLSLVDDTDEAKASLQEKLDTFATKLGGTTRVEANNPAPTVQTPTSKEELIGKIGDPSIRPRERDELTRQYLRNSESLKNMKRQAGIEPPAQ